MVAETGGPSRPTGRWQRWPRWVLALLLVVGLLGAALAVRSGIRLYHLLTGPPPMPRQIDLSSVEGWMTPAYVARAYQVPPNDLARALDLSPEEARRVSIDDLARQRDLPAGQIVEQVRQAIVDLRTRQGRPLPPTPPRAPPAPRPAGASAGT